LSAWADRLAIFNKCIDRRMDRLGMACSSSSSGEQQRSLERLSCERRCGV